jgi:hypothetical protein
MGNYADSGTPTTPPVRNEQEPQIEDCAAFFDAKPGER